MLKLVNAALILFFVCMAHANAAEPLRALLLTTPGVYHDYESQTEVLTTALAQRMQITFDVSLSEEARWRDGDFARDYDVIIYNICMADIKDAALIGNLRRQTEAVGVPAVAIHCTMHSFRDTELWWPFLGLKTRHHDPLGEMRIRQVNEHPVLSGIRDKWTLPEDELYINLAFGGEPLLTATGQDGQEHTVAWLQGAGSTTLFGTTLGHSDDAIANPVFQQLIANAVLFVTGNLDEQGKINPAVAPSGSPGKVINSFSAPPGVGYLGENGIDCVYRQFAIALGPCYVGCILNPFVWGEQADTCRRGCEQKLPSTDEAIRQCMPDD